MEVLYVFWSLKQLRVKYDTFYTNGTSNIQIQLKFLSAMPFLYLTSPFQKRIRRLTYSTVIVCPLPYKQATHGIVG